jgi:DNA repair exonuclease SbcCD ATPase subunit
MSDYLHAVRSQLEAGAVSGQELVLLFRAAEEAEQQRDIESLDEALRLAEQVTAIAGDALRPEAEQLLALCEERLNRVRETAKVATTPAAGEVCPDCGRPLPDSAVRCRACGTLLV